MQKKESDLFWFVCLDKDFFSLRSIIKNDKESLFDTVLYVGTIQRHTERLQFRTTEP